MTDGGPPVDADPTSAEGPDHEGPGDQGPGDQGPDDQGPDDQGPDDQGPDDVDAVEDAVPGTDGPRAGGALVLVGTPIGNLGDLSTRAVESLATASVIYCEDTRHSRKLLTHAGISGVPLRSLHEHNEVDRIDEVVAAVGAGRLVALVSDAGMPGVSDPGSRVVAAVADAGHIVTVVPGPSAVLAALVASGLPTDRFCFEGFLPRSGKERADRLAVVAGETRTSILFEAPGRTGATLRDLARACGGDRSVAVARELTKLHEEVWRGSLDEAAAWAAEGLRGEVVLVVGGAPLRAAVEVGDDVLTAALSEEAAAGSRTRGAVDRVAAAHGVPRRRVYELALRVKHGDGDDGGGTRAS